MADSEHLIQTEVYTPEGEVFRGEVEMVSSRTTVGEVGVKANHVPMLARLVPTRLRLHLPGGELREYAQGEGWLQVFANEALVLCEEAVPPAELDSVRLREKIADAEQRAAEAEEGSAAHRMAERDRVRAEAFLEVAASR